MEKSNNTEIRAPSTKETFHLRFLPWFLVSLFVFFLVFYALLKIHDDNFFFTNWIAILLVITIGIIGSFKITREWIDRFEILVDAEGIQSYDWLSRSHYVKWSEIKRVSTINLLIFRYHRLHCSGKRYPVWAPARVSDQERFRIVIINNAGRSNPLSEALLEDSD